MDFRAEFEKAVEQLADLKQQREEIEIRIARHKRKLAALAELCADNETGEHGINLDLGGLTEACRTVLRASHGEWLSVSEVKTALAGFGFPIKDYKAPAQSISTTLKRLWEADEVTMKKHGSDTTKYKWVGATHAQFTQQEMPRMRGLAGLPPGSPKGKK